MADSIFVAVSEFGAEGILETYVWDKMTMWEPSRAYENSLFKAVATANASYCHLLHTLSEVSF